MVQLATSSSKLIGNSSSPFASVKEGFVESQEAESRIGRI